jgi:tetratricopeptide (TPR) repeat protein
MGQIKMTKLVSSSNKTCNLQEKIKILHKKAQDCVYEELMSAGIDKNQRLLLYDKAIEFLDESIKLDSILLKTYNLKAYIYIMSGRPKMALKPLKIILELDPDNKTAKEFHQALSSDLQN